MGLAEFLYFETALVVGVLATAGYGMLALPRAYYRTARVCFTLAAIGFVGIGIMWGITTIESFWIRAAVSGAFGLIGAIGLTEALRH
jgi:hypothetical protein